MAVLATVSSDLAVLSRWSQAAGKAGYECLLVAPPVLQRQQEIAADLCFFDLGQRPAAELASLMRVVEAFPQIPFVAMTARPDAREGLQLLRAGVRGYCNRLASAQLIAVLLASLESGEIWAGREVTDFLLANATSSHAEPGPDKSALTDSLTERETDIAGQVAAGRSNKVIAADSGISERTVKAHLNSIFRKTGIRNRVQLALAMARESDDRRPQLTG